MIEISKVIKSLSNLNRWEVRALKKFMESPYFVSETKKKVFDVIIEYSPNYKDYNITLEDISKNAFPSEPFDKPKIVNTLSDINLLVERFLVAELLKKNPFFLEKMKATAFHQKNNFRTFERKVKIALKQLTYPDVFTGFEQQALKNQLHYYPYEKNKDLSPIHLKDANDSLDEIYVINKLRYQCEFLSRQQSFANQEGYTFKAEVEDIAKKLRKDNNVIDLYMNIISLYTSSNEALYLETKKKFIREIKKIPVYEASVIIILLTSYANHHYNQKIAAYLYYQLELYKVGLEHKLFTLKGYIPHGDFINICVIATLAKDIVFTEYFIDKYVPLSQKSYQIYCEKLGNAYLYFAQKNYANAVNMTRDIPTKETSDNAPTNQIFFSLRVHFIELRHHFEEFALDYSYKTIFLSKFKGFKKFLLKQKDKTISTSKVNSYLNHLQILKSITKQFKNRQPIELKVLEELRAEVYHTSPLIAWEYLLEKIDELEQSRSKLKID